MSGYTRSIYSYLRELDARDARLTDLLGRPRVSGTPAPAPLTEKPITDDTLAAIRAAGV